MESQYVEFTGEIVAEVTVRLNVYGFETVDGLEESGNIVLREFRDEILQRILAKDPKPVGGAFKVTLAYKNDLDFVIPDEDKQFLQRELDEIKQEQCCDQELPNVYSPRLSLS